MPRTGTTYSAPASSWNPAVDTTQIDVSDWNALLADLSTALTNSLTRGETTAYTLTLLDDANAAAARSTLGVEAAYADVASAATTDIGATSGQWVRITGTTTITGLGTATAGTARFVRFAGALTLTHNGTSLILPGAANITTAANDCAVFVSLGSGNWLCAAYQPATTARMRALAGFTSAVIDQAYAEYTAATGFSTILPIDDTMPQVTEGTQIISLAFTPKSTTSRLRVEFRGMASADTGTNWLTAALFINGAADAVSGQTGFIPGANQTTPLVFDYEYVPGTVSTQTFTVRAGPGGASNMYFNGNSSGRFLGGTQRASLVVYEFAV